MQCKHILPYSQFVFPFGYPHLALEVAAVAAAAVRQKALRNWSTARELPDPGCQHVRVCEQCSKPLVPSYIQIHIYIYIYICIYVGSNNVIIVQLCSTTPYTHLYSCKKPPDRQLVTAHCSALPMPQSYLTLLPHWSNERKRIPYWLTAAASYQILVGFSDKVSFHSVLDH